MKDIGGMKVVGDATIAGGMLQLLAEGDAATAHGGEIYNNL